jgi:hypothetical protein
MLYLLLGANALVHGIMVYHLLDLQKKMQDHKNRRLYRGKQLWRLGRLISAQRRGGQAGSTARP